MKKNKKHKTQVSRGAGVVLLAGRNHTIPNKKKARDKKACRR